MRKLVKENLRVWQSHFTAFLWLDLVEKFCIKTCTVMFDAIDFGGALLYLHTQDKGKMSMLLIMLDRL